MCHSAYKQSYNFNLVKFSQLEAKLRADLTAPNNGTKVRVEVGGVSKVVTDDGTQMMHE